MANASKHHMGAGAQGKHSGTGAMTPESTADGLLGENQVLSNRDKSVGTSDQRGLDSQAMKNEQRQDNARNRQIPASETRDTVSNSSGMSAPMSTTSGQDSSLRSQRDEAGGLADPDPDAPDNARGT